MAPFSARSRFPTHPNRLNAALARARAAGQSICDLTESNPTHTGLAPSASELLPLLQTPQVARYQPEPFGLASARRAIAVDLAGRGFAVPDVNIMLSASTSEAYGFLFKLLCDPGDSVLVPAPSYPLFDVLAQLEQVRLVPYRLAYDGEWHLDSAALRSALEPRTRAVITVHPNNPTGSFLKRGELNELAALGLPIVSDEVFADYALREDTERAASALEIGERALVFCLGGLSKACALPQLKLAWTVMAGPAAQVAAARDRLEHIADAYLSPGTQVQLALPALWAARASTRPRVLERGRANRAELRRAVHASAADVLRVEGGWYAIVRVPAVLSDEEWALTLLERDGVLVQPGYYYELTHGAHLVLSLICGETAFANGAARLAARVRALAT